LHLILYISNSIYLGLCGYPLLVCSLCLHQFYVSVCSSVLQYVVVCCSVIQCVFAFQLYVSGSSFASTDLLNSLCVPSSQYHSLSLYLPLSLIASTSIYQSLRAPNSDHQSLSLYLPLSCTLGLHLLLYISVCASISFYVSISLYVSILYLCV